MSLEAMLDDVAMSLAMQHRVIISNHQKDWGVDTHLKELKSIVETINVLLQVSEGNMGQPWLDKLRDVVYELDNVLDELVTRAKMKQLMEGTVFSKEVKLFFSSSSNQLLRPVMLARQLKFIRECLDDLTRNKVFNKSNLVPPKEPKAEMGEGNYNGFLTHHIVVGRENEKYAIISMLLDSSLDERVVSVIPIVGSGGLGKTTLAWEVYNDEQVKDHFELHIWVDVPCEITVKELMEKVVVAAGENPSHCDLNELKIRLARIISSKKFLLVLDNLGEWNNDSLRWEDVETYLSLGAMCGSKILLTTRRLEVSRTIATGSSYELQPLNEDESWTLFEKTVFYNKGFHDFELREKARESLKKCKNVPLAIRAVADVVATNVSVEYWPSFRHNELLNSVSTDDDLDVMLMLKLSYDHLRPTNLKSCFSYCSLFPRGYVFNKKKLVNLWIAQGFVHLPHEGQSLEKAGEDYLNILLNRSFLLDVKGDESERTCKLHDLMYDLSLSVMGGQCRVLSSLETNDYSQSIRHISIGYQINLAGKVPIALKRVKQLRSFLLAERPSHEAKLNSSVCNNLISSFHRLRALDLHGLGIKKVPKLLRKMIHLRYLDLSNNNIKRLPKSITSLYNLQYLNLRGCRALAGLPRDLNKLVNLRCLELDVFTVSKNRGLSDLSSLNSLTGELTIDFQGYYPGTALDAREANMKAKKNLQSLTLKWTGQYYEEDEMVLEALHPSNELSKLTIDGYIGRELPSWMTTLPLLTSIEIFACPKIENIPSFAQLHNLKSMRFAKLPDVEYMEINAAKNEASSLTTFFRSLTKIVIEDMPSLKGWRESKAGDDLSFLGVAEVYLHNCRKLEYIPWCPNVKKLSLAAVEKPSIILKKSDTSSSPSSSSSLSVAKLETLEIDTIEYLFSLPRECLHKVSELKFFSSPIGFVGPKPLDLSNLEEGLKGMTSLQTLKFHAFQGLKSLSRFPPQLNNLLKLEFMGYDSISFSDVNNASWAVLKSLCSLKFVFMPNLEVLPQGLRHLTALRSLDLRTCFSLMAIPDWIDDLCSLSRIEIYLCPEISSLPEGIQRLRNLKLFVVDDCPVLARRCRRERGADWQKINHIPDVIIKI